MEQMGDRLIQLGKEGSGKISRNCDLVPLTGYGDQRLFLGRRSNNVLEVNGPKVTIKITDGSTKCLCFHHVANKIGGQENGQTNGEAENEASVTSLAMLNNKELPEIRFWLKP